MPHFEGAFIIAEADRWIGPNLVVSDWLSLSTPKQAA